MHGYHYPYWKTEYPSNYKISHGKIIRHHDMGLMFFPLTMESSLRIRLGKICFTELKVDYIMINSFIFFL